MRKSDHLLLAVRDVFKDGSPGGDCLVLSLLFQLTRPLGPHQLLQALETAALRCNLVGAEASRRSKDGVLRNGGRTRQAVTASTVSETNLRLTTPRLLRLLLREVAE